MIYFHLIEKYRKKAKHFFLNSKFLIFENNFISIIFEFFGQPFNNPTLILTKIYHKLYRFNKKYLKNVVLIVLLLIKE